MISYNALCKSQHPNISHVRCQPQNLSCTDRAAAIKITQVFSALTNLRPLANVGNGFMAASRSNIIVGENASLEIASMVWVCAGAKILGPDNEKICIGAGSIVAPGATASVDVPDNTIVVNHNEFRPIRPENPDFPSDWLNTEWRDKMIMQFDRSLGRI